MAVSNPAFHLNLSLYHIEKCFCIYGSPFRDLLLKRFWDLFYGSQGHLCSFARLLLHAFLAKLGKHRYSIHAPSSAARLAEDLKRLAPYATV